MLISASFHKIEKLLSKISDCHLSKFAIYLLKSLRKPSVIDYYFEFNLEILLFKVFVFTVVDYRAKTSKIYIFYLSTLGQFGIINNQESIATH